MLDSNILLIILVAIGTFILLMSVRTLRIRLKDSIYLTMATVFAFLFAISVLIMMYFNFTGNAQMFLLFQKITIIPFLSIFISGYFYYECFITIKPPMIRLIPMLISFTFVLTYDIFNVFILTDFQLHIFALMITFYYATVFHIFAIIVYRRLLKLWDRLAIKVDMASLILVGTATFFAGTAFGLEYFGVVSYFSFPQLIFLGIAMVTMVIGIGVLMVNQLKWGDYVFYIPIPLHNILIYNGGGVLIYSRAVRTHSDKKILKHNETLISGGLAGFSMFFNEVLGSKEKLSHISLSSYEFLFSDLPKSSGTLVVVTSGANYFLKKSLEKFKALISPEMLDDFKNQSRIDLLQEKIDETLTKAFPYLVIDKDNPNA